MQYLNRLPYYDLVGFICFENSFGKSVGKGESIHVSTVFMHSLITWLTISQNATNLQQMTEKTSWQNYGTSLVKYYYWIELKNEKLIILPQCFQMLSAAAASERVYMLERIDPFQISLCCLIELWQLHSNVFIIY